MHAHSRHLALFYNGDADLWQQLSALRQQLLTGAEHWLYVADEHSGAAAQQALELHCGLEPTGCTVVASAELALRDPTTSVEVIISALERALGALQVEQAGGPVLLVEMSWAIHTPTGTILLREYEAAIDGLVARGELLVICLYNQSVLLDRQLLNGLHMHGALCGADGQLQANPHYVPSAIFAQRNERAQFHYWLGQLRAGGGLPSAPASAAPPSGQLQPIYHFESPTPLLSTASGQQQWQIESLGQLRVQRISGNLVQWDVPGGATYKTKTLFAYLLFRGEEGAPTSELADLLWPAARSLQQSLNRLYHTVRCLRQALSPGLAGGRESPFVIHRDDRYYLAVPSRTWVDLPVFQEHAYRGNQHQQNQQFEQALQCYQSAKRLYRGDLLGDLPAKYTDHAENDWCWSRRYWFRSMYLKILGEMAAIQRRLGSISDALAHCDEALRIEPCSDMIHQEKMRVLHAAKRRDALHRQYRLYCKALAQFEMGEPTEATTRLYHALIESI